jgi:hypothetical protein
MTGPFNPDDLEPVPHNDPTNEDSSVIERIADAFGDDVVGDTPQTLIDDAQGAGSFLSALINAARDLGHESSDGEDVSHKILKPKKTLAEEFWDIDLTTLDDDEPIQDA